MSWRATVALVYLSIGACNSGSANRSDDAPVLRVAALPGLTAELLVPSERFSGSAGAVSELLYDLANEHSVIVDRRGSTVFLERTPSSPLSAQDIADNIRFRGLVGAEVRGQGIAVELASPERAAAFAESGEGAIAVGPYRLADEHPPGALRLIPRRESLPIIEVIPVEQRVHWQLLLGGQIDVLPDLGSAYVGGLRDVDSVTILELVSRNFYAVALNAGSSRFDDTGERRSVAAVLSRLEVSGLLCEDCEASLPGASRLEPTNGPGAEPIAPFAIMALGDAKEEELGLRGLANQVWRKTGIRPALDLVPMPELAARIQSGEFEAVLLPLSNNPDRTYRAAVSKNGGYLGFGTDELESAIEAKEWSKVAEACSREGLLVPLWRQKKYAAVNDGWCGARPELVTSWRWLSELRWCGKSAR